LRQGIASNQKMLLSARFRAKILDDGLKFAASSQKARFP
jgi:hypothetical protein